MSKQEKIEQALGAQFPEDDISVTDYAGDGDHFTIKITSKKFKGMGLVQRQRLVNEALKKVDEDVHAYQFDLKD